MLQRYVSNKDKYIDILTDDVSIQRAPAPAFFCMKPTSYPQGNVPYDVGAASLFDTAYVHPLVRDSFLPYAYYDRFAKYTTWLVSGTMAGLDQWVGEISPERFHASKSRCSSPIVPIEHSDDLKFSSTSLPRQSRILASNIVKIPLSTPSVLTLPKYHLSIRRERRLI